MNRRSFLTRALAAMCAAPALTAIISRAAEKPVTIHGERCEPLRGFTMCKNGKAVKVTPMVLVDGGGWVGARQIVWVEEYTSQKPENIRYQEIKIVSP